MATDLTAGYLEHVRVEKRLAQRTVELYSLDLQKLAHYAQQAGVELLAVRNSHIRRWVAQMHSGGRSGRGIALILSGWRGFYVWLGRQGLIDSNPVQGVRAPKVGKPLPKALSVDQSVQLASFASDSNDAWLEARDAAIVELLYGGGLRVGELTGLDLHSSAQARGWLDLQAGQAHVLGKGSKRRTVPIGAMAVQALQHWLALRDPLAQHSAQAALFIGRNGTRLSAQSVLATPAPAQLAGWPGAAGASAYAAPLVCQPPVAVEQRFARRAGTAGARQYHHHAGLYAARFPAPGQSLRCGASQGQDHATGAEVGHT